MAKNNIPVLSEVESPNRGKFQKFSVLLCRLKRDVRDGMYVKTG